VLLDSRIYCALEEQTLFNVQSMIGLDNGPSEWVAAVPVWQWYCSRLSEFTLSNDVYQRLVNSL
jgi:hypothetical protein